MNQHGVPSRAEYQILQACDTWRTIGSIEQRTKIGDASLHTICNNMHQTRLLHRKHEQHDGRTWVLYLRTPIASKILKHINLEALEKLHDQRRHGTIGRKITEADVRAIRADKRSNSQLGEIYGVNPTTISQIKLRQTWDWVTD